MSVVARSLRSTITLNDGVAMPMFGLGMYRTDTGIATQQATMTAIKHGYMLIDTAEMYRNEEDVGRGIKASGVAREDIFIVTKLWNHGKQICYDTFAQSLRKLDTSYVDLYLVHHPMGGHVLESYDAMLDLKEQGLIRSVGVSNFNIHHLEALKAAGRPVPSVNQIQLHAFQHLRPLVEYCSKHGITVMGYSPLARMQKQENVLLNNLAKKYQKTVAQVMIRWSVQKGYITIPKSSQPERIIANSEVFDFELTTEELKDLDSLPTHSCTSSSFTPLQSAWEG